MHIAGLCVFEGPAPGSEGTKRTSLVGQQEQPNHGERRDQLAARRKQRGTVLVEAALIMAS